MKEGGKWLYNFLYIFHTHTHTHTQQTLLTVDFPLGCLRSFHIIIITIMELVNVVMEDS
jgi:hypothetical protein